MALGQARFAHINANLSDKLSQKKCLIAVHRGSWGGNITQNTIGAYKAAFQSYNFGEGAAIGVLWLVILAVITLISNKLSGKYAAD